MKKLTYSVMATARLRGNKKSYYSMILGIFLSIFLVSAFILGAYAIYDGTLAQRHSKVGNLDMVVLDNDQLTDEDLLALGDYDRLGHAYVTGMVSGSTIHIGYYDETGIELLDLIPLEGRLPQGPGEIAMEASAMEVLEGKWSVGQTVELEILPVDGIAEKRSYVIVGILPERSVYLHVSDHPGVSYFPSIVTGPNEPAFSSGRLSFHFMMGLKHERELFTAVGHFWEQYRRPGIMSAMFGLSLSGKQVQVYTLEDVTYVDNELFNMLTMAAMLAVALILSSCVGISVAMEGILSKRQEEIGVLRAIGATRRQIRRIFQRENLLLALAVSPVAICAACVGVWLLSVWMPEQLAFRFRLWLVLPIAVCSVLVIMLSGYFPLVRASKLMPMSVIRDTAMLRRSKKLRSKKVFRVSKLISQRQIRFHPTRHLGAVILVGLMLLTCRLSTTILLSYMSYSEPDEYGYSLDYNGSISMGYIPVYGSEPMSYDSIRQIGSLNKVQAVRVNRRLPILLDLPNVTRYAYVLDREGQFGSLDDRAFEEAMSLLPMDSSQYWEERSSDRQEYLQLCKGYDFTGQVFQTSIVTLDLNSENLRSLTPCLSEGSIDLDAINEGRAVLIYAPNVWSVQIFTDGFKSYTTSQEKPTPGDPSWAEPELIAWNDSFTSGQSLSMTQLYRTEEDGPVTRQDLTVPVCGILKELPEELTNFWGQSAVITTEQGLENMQLRPEGIETVRVYLEDTTIEDEERLLRQITAISRRRENYSVQNRAELLRKIEQSNRQTVLLFGAIFTLFFTVSVGMIVSSITRQLHSQGRTIGMLRAVGAEESTLLGCYSGRIRTAVWGGFALVGGGSAFIDILNVIQNKRVDGIIVGGSALAIAAMVIMTVLCHVLCRFLLRLRIRKILRMSIIDNIREL